MNKCFASGGLKKFMDARERGASDEDLRRLMFAAASGGRPAKSPDRSLRPIGTPKADDKPHRPVVDLDAERAKRAAEWESAPLD
jgi:hypothetical protein